MPMFVFCQPFLVMIRRQSGIFPDNVRPLVLQVVLRTALAMTAERRILPLAFASVRSLKPALCCLVI